MPKTPRFTPTGPLAIRTRRIEMLAYPGIQLLDVAGPLQVFASVNDLLAKERPTDVLPYEPRVVAAGGGMVGTSSGLGLAVQPLPRSGEPVDTVFVPGGPGVDAAAMDPALVGWIQRRAGQANRVASVCTGAFLLGAAGILDRRRATTHWSSCKDLSQRFPHTQVESDPIFVRDGKVWTSAGVTAGIDLTLALVEEDLGREIALAVARLLVVFLKRPGGQAQFSTALSLQATEERFGALHQWMSRHLAHDLSLPVLANRAGMSERNFSRRYVEATGLTPMRAVEQLRAEAARRLLSETRLPVKRISQRCGFGTEETMRRSFLRLLSITPQDYRKRFSFR